jgi:hypothetical protein
MKSLFVLFLMMMSTLSWGKELNDFNHSLLEGVQKDISSDNDQTLRKKHTIGRGPASVAPDQEGSQIYEVQKVDKMNIRQIGPNKW